MKTKFVLIVALTVALSKSAESQSEDDGDRYNPLIRLLKQLRRRDRYRNHYNSYNKEETTVAPAASNVDTLSIEPANRIANSNSNLDQDAIKKLIADSQAQSPSSGSVSGSNVDSTTRRPDLIYDPIVVTKVPAQRIEQINRGVSTILGGVGGGSLEQILRGSFMFTRNENVRTVANNVLDSIFGRRTQ